MWYYNTGTILFLRNEPNRVNYQYTLLDSVCIVIGGKDVLVLDPFRGPGVLTRPLWKRLERSRRRIAGRNAHAGL